MKLEDHYTPEEIDRMHPYTAAILRYFPFQILPVEGALYFNTWVSAQKTAKGTPAGTAMIGLYSEQPYSVSCFHRLEYDEVWHVYGGDPFRLILLHPDGTSEEIIMGTEPHKGHTIQTVIPAHTWQAGELLPGGRYALFGCTMAPGFDGTIFEAAVASELIAQYPERAEDILRLSINADQTHMPEGYTV